jgi:hypothetical protein
MIRTQIKIKYGGIYIKETLEFWYKYLVVHCSEGNMRPRFFLPVRRSYQRNTTECWIFPLAPFVLFYFLVSTALWAIWEDLIITLDSFKKS